MKYSKIILLLAVWFAYTGVMGTMDSFQEFGSQGVAYSFGMIFSAIVCLISSAGLLMHKKWVMWFYLIQLPFSLVFNGWWFLAHHPEKYGVGTAAVMALIEIVPLVLIWFRRDHLGPGFIGMPHA